jgi:hypothetical protein
MRSVPWKSVALRRFLECTQRMNSTAPRSKVMMNVRTPAHRLDIEHTLEDYPHRTVVLETRSVESHSKTSCVLLLQIKLWIQKHTEGELPQIL